MCNLGLQSERLRLANHLITLSLGEGGSTESCEACASTYTVVVRRLNDLRDIDSLWCRYVIVVS